jgi:integral membrane protein
MPLAPKLEEFPKIRGALKWYQVSAYITGFMLLLLCAEMVVKYGLGFQLFALSNYGALTLVPVKTAVPPTGIDLSTGILIAHGWLYVLYLFCDFRLWSLMRWSFARFVMIALGGVVPFLSFIVETRISKQVKTYLAGREAEAAPTPVEAAN